jgi:hypothetical protein
MDKFEKAELICKKCGVTFEQAREALDASNEDVLDAVVWLERAGKTAQGTCGQYQTSAVQSDQTSEEMSQAQSDYERSTAKKADFGAAFSRCWGWFRGLLRKGLETSFVVQRHGKRTLAIPTLLFAVLVVCAFWVCVPLLVIGLFFEYKYSFEGIGEVTLDVNDIMDRASDGAAQLKQDVTGSKADEK